ncbi:MAG: RNA polymerase sigma factor [Patescibacteria group bacterium]|jgi:RNA polymerase sigma-70 factor (ECF subfamily)|nr:RNA polymerase sigma factor [Patescibacteria group bacterium]
MNEKDRDIIERFQKGDTDSFVILYDKYIDKIYKFIYFKTSHKETAEDLCTQTFLKALNKLPSFKIAGKDYFSPWLYSIARNLVIDHYRKKASSKNNINIDDVWDLSDNTDIERDIDFKEKTKLIANHLKKLNVEQREIIMLKIFEDLSYKEIAKIIDKSEDACKMSFSRAIKTLKKEIPVSALISLFFIKL